MNEEQSVNLEATKYSLLESLTAQEGWVILLDLLNKRKAVIVNSLLTEQSHKNIIHLQEMHIALDTIINSLQNARTIKEHYMDQIQAIRKDKELREEYNL